jgi:hypothetical protein
MLLLWSPMQLLLLASVALVVAFFVPYPGSPTCSRGWSRHPTGMERCRWT